MLRNNFALCIMHYELIKTLCLSALRVNFFCYNLWNPCGLNTKFDKFSGNIELFCRICDFWNKNCTFVVGKKE